MRPVRFAVFSSGIVWQSPGLRQAGIDPEILYYRKRLPRLSRYDVLVIPKGLPVSYLRRIGPSLSAFLEQDGGIVLSFGEFRGDWRKDVGWTPASGQRQIKVGSEMALMFPCPNACMTRRAGESDYADFPGEFESWVLAPHGEYDRIPNGARPLAFPNVPGEQNEHPVAFVENFASGGALLAMTLDPDYHAYQGSDCAYCLLNMIIAWAKEAAEASRQRRLVGERAQGAWKRAITGLTRERRSRIPRDVGIGVVAGVFVHALAHWL